MAKDQKLAAGQKFGQWTLTGDEPLGKGGNGTVWGAVGPTGTAVAVKLLHKHHFQSKRLTRFRDEVLFLRNEEGRPGLLPLLDANLPDNPTPEDRPWLVTPLATPFTGLMLAGTTKFQELIRRMQYVAKVLADLHQEGKWHRDLKPDNLFDVNGESVIGDFGLVDYPGKDPITEDTEILGPLFYVAPEMMTDAADQPAGPADVYSLAKTLWVLASGQRYPLPGPQRMDDRPLRLSTYCPHPRAHIIDRLLDRATEHNPSHRPAMAEISDELAAWLQTPETGPVQIDIESVAKEYQGVFEVSNRADRQRQNLLKEAAEVLSSFDEVIEQLATATRKATNIDPETGTAYDLPKRVEYVETFGRPLVAWREARQVETAIGDMHFLRLGSFVQVEALENGHIRLCAGHLVRYEVGRSRNTVQMESPWSDEAIAPTGSAQLHNAVQAMKRALIESLPAAIQLFGQWTKRIHQP